MPIFRNNPMPVRLLGQGLVLALLFGTLLGLSACRQKTPEERLVEAQELLAERQVALAVRRIQDVIDEHPGEPITIDARFLLTQVYMSLGREDAVRSAIEQLQAIAGITSVEDQAGQQALTMITELYLALDEPEAAIAHSASIVEQASGIPVLEDEARIIHNILLLSAGDEEQMDEAREFLRGVIVEAESEPLRHQAREILADHYRRREMWQESNEVYDLFLDAYPGDPVNAQIMMAQALNLRQMEDAAAAEARFDEGAEAMLAHLEEEEDANARADVLRTLSQFYEAFERPDEAEEMLRRIMADQPATLAAINAQFGIGQLRTRRGDLDGAIELFRQMQRENPESDIGQTAESWVLLLESAKEEGVDLTGEPGEAGLPVPGDAGAPSPGEDLIAPLPDDPAAPGALGLPPPGTGP